MWGSLKKSNFRYRKRPENTSGRKILDCIFFHPDFTVGCGISPQSTKMARGLKDKSYYHRSGITPYPEEQVDYTILHYISQQFILFNQLSHRIWGKTHCLHKSAHCNCCRFFCPKVLQDGIRNRQ